MINLSQCKNLDLGLEPSFCLIYPFNLDKKSNLYVFLNPTLKQIIFCTISTTLQSSKITVTIWILICHG